MRHKFHAFMLAYFAHFRQTAIAALFHGQINQHRPWLHAFQHFLGHQLRCRTTRDERGANHNILFGDMFGYQSGLALFIIGAHFFGIAASGFAAIVFIGFDHHEGAAKAFHLLGRSTANIGGRYNGAQTFGGRNGLQTSHASAHNKNTRRRHCASRRHHHRQSPTIFMRRIQNRFIARQV